MLLNSGEKARNEGRVREYCRNTLASSNRGAKPLEGPRERNSDTSVLSCVLGQELSRRQSVCGPFIVFLGHDALLP